MPSSASFRSTGAKIGSFVGALLFVFWGMWRWFIVSGGPWKPGHSCDSLVACMDGLCLVHELPAPGAPLSPTAGYCSKRCQVTADCPGDMACEALPQGISRKDGDHLPFIELPSRLCVRVKAPAR